jgi:hypothetical protein
VIDAQGLGEFVGAALPVVVISTAVELPSAVDVLPYSPFTRPSLAVPPLEAT